MSPRRVLVIDDSGTWRSLCSRLFENKGLEVRAAASVQEAAELIRDPSARPDLVISDIAMPGLDGITFLKTLRAAPETAEIPAILISGLDLPEGVSHASAEAAGVGPVFRKGDALELLWNRAEALLRGPAGSRSGFQIDPLKRAVWIGGIRLPKLAARRFALLCALLNRPEGAGREELAVTVWDSSENPNLVDVTVLRLREDLQTLPFIRIKTIAGGYRLALDPPYHL